MNERRINAIEDRENLGKNVEINITIARHAQKETGHATDATGPLDVSISEEGRRRASFFGKMLKREGKDPKVIGTTFLARSVETAEEMLKGAEALDPRIRKFMSLGIRLGSKYFYNTYLEIATRNAERYMRENYPPGTKFEDLNRDEQELIMSYAEEEAVEWYLSHKDSPLKDGDITLTPKQSAAISAYQISRFVALPEYLKNDSKKDYLVVSHRMIPEQFLIYTALEKDEDHIDEKSLNPVEKLRRMGGSLAILDSFDIMIKTDNQGRKAVEILWRTKKYRMDLNKLKELAQIGKGIIEEAVKKE